MSTSDQGKASSEMEHVPASKIPAGLETLYALEKDQLKSPLGVLILAVHWSIVRAGLRILTGTGVNANDSGRKYTERLPRGWADGTPNSSTPVFTFEYVDPAKPDVKYQVKVIEIVPDLTAVVTLTDSSIKTSASTFQLQNFIQFDASRTVAEDVPAESVLFRATELESQIWTELMEPLGLKVVGVPPFQGPYDDKIKSDTGKKEEAEEKEKRPRQPVPGYHDDPLRVDRPFPRRGPGMPSVGPEGGFNPLFGPPVGGGGYGRSDLDPFGGFGGGMIADPRGFRNPRIDPGRLPPGAVPPGARFDPFGPPMPRSPNVPGIGGNWAVPNPDELPPPGFRDMFM